MWTHAMASGRWVEEEEESEQVFVELDCIVWRRKRPSVVAWEKRELVTVRREQCNHCITKLALSTRQHHKTPNTNLYMEEIQRW